MAVRSGPLEKSKYMAESMEKVMEKTPKESTEASKLVSFVLKKATSPMELVMVPFIVTSEVISLVPFVWQLNKKRKAILLIKIDILIVEILPPKIIK